MLTPAEADAAIAAALEQVPDEELPLSACAGRVLRRAVRAERDSPPFDRVTMDGIAFAGAPEDGARREFRMAGIAPAGAPALKLESPSDCIEVMTGAVLPLGCDTVVPVERIRATHGKVSIDDAYEPKAWLHVHRRAADACAGDSMLEPGTRIGAPELAIAASAGPARLTVSRLPRIAVISTGDELVEPGGPILDHQLRRSNSYGLGAALTLAGFAPATDLHLPDRKDRLASSLEAALDTHDVLVLSGGVSAGRFDHVPSVLEALRVKKILHQIAQRPGRPLWFGVGEAGQAVFALPGNPVSALVCLARYVRPALARLSGADPPARKRAVLARQFDFEAPLTCFLPVRLLYDHDGRAMAEPRPTGGSGDFVSLAGTDGFVELPRGPATHQAGLVVPFHHW
ncbi:MAG: molybdopterin molybdotransferase MoeA [Steroidobacteraceae bacterium]